MSPNPSSKAKLFLGAGVERAFIATIETDTADAVIRLHPNGNADADAPLRTEAEQIGEIVQRVFEEHRTRPSLKEFRTLVKNEVLTSGYTLRVMTAARVQTHRHDNDGEGDAVTPIATASSGNRTEPVWFWAKSPADGEFLFHIGIIGPACNAYCAAKTHLTVGELA